MPMGVWFGVGPWQVLNRGEALDSSLGHPCRGSSQVEAPGRRQLC